MVKSYPTKLTIVLLATVANAALTDMHEMYKEISNSTGSTGSATNDLGPLRSFSPGGGMWGWVGQAVMDMIGEGYGCWCYFQDDVGKGKSDPVDELDSICKALHQGYECAMIDDPTCVPYEVEYNRPNVFWMANKDQILPACENLNSGNECHINACASETNFVFQIFNAANPNSDDNQHKSDGTGFDVEANCPITHGETGEKSCCGVYPDRFPYKSFDGIRACCGKGTYDTGIQECCEEGGEQVVRLVCN